MGVRASLALAVAGGFMMVSAVATPVLATDEPTVGFGPDHPIVVDRDFKVVDVDGDGKWDWFNFAPDNTHLTGNPPPDRPNSIAAPRFEWDLTPAEIEAAGRGRVIVELTPSVAFFQHRLTLSVNGVIVAGGVVSTDISAAVHSWIEQGANGPLTIDVLRQTNPILTREFTGSEWHEPSPAKIILSETVEEAADEVQVRGYSGKYRIGNYSRLGSNSIWETVPTAAERNGLLAASKIEFRVRVVECGSRVGGSGLAITYSHDGSTGYDAASGLEVAVLATEIEGMALEGGYLYIDVTDYVHSHLEAAYAFQIRLLDPADGGEGCKLAMGDAGQPPWQPRYSNVLALNGDRPIGATVNHWQVGELGTCRASIGPEGIARVTTTVAAEAVSMEVATRVAGNPWSGRRAFLEVGDRLDFSMGTGDESELRYRASFSKDGESETVACGRVPFSPVLSRPIIELAQANLGEALAEKVSLGERYGGWRYWDWKANQSVSVVVDLSNPDVIVATSLPLVAVPDITPFNAHELALGDFDRLRWMTMDADGVVDALRFTSDAPMIFRETTGWGLVAYGSSPDEVIANLVDPPPYLVGTWHTGG